MSNEHNANSAAGMMPLPEAVRAAGISVHAATVRRAIRAGRIAGCRVGERWHTTPAAILSALVQPVGPIGQKS